VFDDPFVTFDDERAMEVLKELAADHHVLYLTCSDRYDAAADAVVVLPAPPVIATQPDLIPAPPPSTAHEELTLPFPPTPDA